MYSQQTIESIFIAEIYRLTTNGCIFEPTLRIYFLLDSGGNFTSFCIRTFTMSAGVPIIPPMKPDVPASNTLVAKPAFESNDCFPTS